MLRVFELGLLETNLHGLHVKIPKEFLALLPVGVPHTALRRAQRSESSTFDTEVGLHGLVFILRRMRRLFQIKGLAQQEIFKKSKTLNSY